MRLRQPKPKLAAVRATLYLLALVLPALALLASIGTVQAGGPVEQPERGKPRAWYRNGEITKLPGKTGVDTRMLPTPFKALYEAVSGHLHAGLSSSLKVTAPSIGQPRLARFPTAVSDQWSAPVSWSWNNEDQVMIHAALLPSGKLSFVGRETTFSMETTPLSQPLPAVQPMVFQHPPLEFSPRLENSEFVLFDTLYCTAQTLLSDGRLFAASGTRFYLDKASDSLSVIGLGDAMVLDGDTWRSLPPMLGGAVLPEPVRWYPTATRLANKRVLVTGGFEFVLPWIVKNLSAEVYDPISNAWTLITPPGGLPEQLFSHNYPHVFQLPVNTPRGDVLAFGDPGVPGFMQPDGQWSLSSATRPNALPLGQSYKVNSTSLLPIRTVNGEWGYNNGSAILTSGQFESVNERYIDVYDPVSDRWLFRRDMGMVRAYPATVVLPDGRLLILGGEDWKGSAGLGRTQYVDPRKGFSVEWGTEEYPEVRGYHNVSLLLPDGRVLFGSGNENYTRGELPSFRYYSPSYMFEPRPEIDLFPSTLNLGSEGWVTWKGGPPREVVLIGLGAMTHSFDMNQRYIQLPITGTADYNGHHVTWYRTPDNERVAPPGPYMLFVLDENLVPSVAKIVQVQ